MPYDGTATARCDVVRDSPCAIDAPEDSMPCTPGTQRLRRSKRVRFSDPGPQLERGNSSSTGLTPFVSRTTLSPGTLAGSPTTSRAPKKQRDRRRRHTAPGSQIGQAQLKPLNLAHGAEPKMIQYLPFHDIIDARSRRRIGRSGFSEAMDEVHRKRKEQEKKQKEKDGELARLRKELELLRNVRTPTEESDMMEYIDEYPTIEIPDISSVITPLLTASAESVSDDINVHACDAMDDDTDTIDYTPMTPLTPSPPGPIDMGVQTSFAFPDPDDQIRTLNEDIESRDNEQNQLFKEWRRLTHLPTPESQTDENPADSTSPPADLTAQVISTLQAATSRASCAIETIKRLYGELSSHGFDGANTSEIIESINERFRRARIELERAVPGETPNASLSNWRGTIDALVDRIHRLVHELSEIQSQIVSCEDRESVLRKQFNATLARLEEASKKNEGLERYSESIAEDMLNMRMTLQSLEKDMETQDRDKTRLHSALEKYRDDVSMLEQLNSKLEDELEATRLKCEKLRSLNSELNDKNVMSENKVRELQGNLGEKQEFVQELQLSLDQRNLDISSIQNRLEYLEREKKNAIVAVEKAAREQSKSHEKEIGSLNAHLSTVTTSLEETKVANEALHAAKAELEDRLVKLKQIFSLEAIQKAQERVNETARAFSDWQRGDEVLSKGAASHDAPQFRHSFAAVGSEPLTPATVSRFKNVEFGRGKKRKRNPSNKIGVVVEEDEWSDPEDLPSSACKAS